MGAVAWLYVFLIGTQIAIEVLGRRRAKRELAASMRVAVSIHDEVERFGRLCDKLNGALPSRREAPTRGQERPS